MCDMRVAALGPSQTLCRGITLSRSRRTTFPPPRLKQRAPPEILPEEEGPRLHATDTPETDGKKELLEMFPIKAPGAGMHDVTGMPAAAHLLLRVALLVRCALGWLGKGLLPLVVSSKVETVGPSIKPGLDWHSLLKPNVFVASSPAIGSVA